MKTNSNMKTTSNKTKVLSVQLGKTLCPTKVPITMTEESTQVQNKNVPKGGGGTGGLLLCLEPF